MGVIKHLNEDDIRNAVRHPDEGRRAAATQKICRQIRKGLSPEDRDFALKILHHIMTDTASMVRRALAVTLRNSPELPRSIARKLIADIDNIAVPVLLESPVLTDDDLRSVLSSRAAAKLRAIAQRPKVSGAIVDDVIRLGDNIAIANLAANDGAELSEATAQKILSLYQSDDLIKNAFINRHDLPVAVVEKLLTLVSEEAAWQINKRHALPVDLAIDLAGRARERASMELFDQLWVSRDLRGLVARIHEQGRLTPSLIIRAAGCGLIAFTEHALSVSGQVPFGKARLMLHDTGPFGVQALGIRAGLTALQIRVLRAACVIYRDLEETGYAQTREQFQARMIERLMSLSLPWSEDEQSWFMERLDGCHDSFLAMPYEQAT
jgi:uncharacterized protein (DUF2336 family)